MALLDWSDALELGYERMDETHREFVAQLNALHAAPDDRFVPLLDAFIEHTAAHFEQEQRWMQEIAFPPAHCHTSEHEGVLNVMRDVRRMVHDEGKYEIGRVLTRELAPWFENHAGSMDAMLSFFLRCIDAGVDPMQQLALQREAGAPQSPCATGACHGAADTVEPSS
jgi:hemerythrin-like metal-binding protein